MYDKITKAAEILAGVANKTPVISSRTLNEITNCQLLLKCENFQRIGAFKFRGAYNAIYQLSEEEKRRGVITYSSGNHAQAVALVGRLLQVKATIIMPADAPKAKIDATKGYGGDVILYNREQVNREDLAAQLVSEHGYVFVPPFDHEDVIAGQGTCAKELIEEVGNLDYLFVPCGGGGLLSGSAVSAKSLSPNCKVIGVEPEAGNDASLSFRTGKLHTINNPETIADGARTPALGEKTFPLIKEYVDDMITVSDEELIQTLSFIWTRMKIVVEPTAALGLAPLFCKKYQAKGKVGVIVTGGNVDIQAVAKLL